MEDVGSTCSPDQPRGCSLSPPFLFLTLDCTHGLGNSCVGFNPDNINEISMVDRLIIQSFNTFYSLNGGVGLCCVAQTSLSKRKEQ